MPPASFVQTNFLGGQWSPFAQGRMDHPRYKTAMAACVNACPIEEGCCTRRPGFWFSSETKSGNPARLISFAFDTVNPYLIEIGDNYCRFRSGRRVIVDPLGGLPVVNLTAANPAVISLTAPPGWNTGTTVLMMIGDVTVSASANVLANRQFSLVGSGSAFSLYDSITGDPLDATGITFNANSLIRVARIVEIVTPYDAGKWKAMRAIQREDEMLLLHGTTPPQSLIVTSQPSSVADAIFGLSPTQFIDGPYLDVPSDRPQLSFSGGLSGALTMTTTSHADINGAQGFKSTDVGRIIRLFSQPLPWSSSATYATNNSVLYPDQDTGVVYTAIGTPTIGVPPSHEVDKWAINPVGQLWRHGTIIQVLSVDKIVVSIDPTQILLYTTPILIWRLGVFSNTTGWPTCGCYHEGRFFVAGAIKNRWDASAVRVSDVKGNIDFTPTLPDGTVTSANAISYIFDSSDRNQIFWMMPDLQGIVVGTINGEWLIQSGTANVSLTPTNVQAHRITKYGCANIEPRRTGLTTVFVQKFGRRVMEYLADAFSGKFYGPNLTEFAKDITRSNVQEIAYQEELAPILWARMGDGRLAGCTYRRIRMVSSEAAEFFGWHEHALGSGRIIESIATGPSVGGTLDALAIVSNDPATGIRHVEVLSDMFDEESVLTNAFFLDDAVVPIQGITVANSIRFFGLWHLNHKKVTAWIGGLDCGDYTVRNGSIDVPYDTANPLFTLRSMTLLDASGVDFGNLAVKIDDSDLIIPAVIGFTYRTHGKLLRPVALRETGAAMGAPETGGFGKTKRVHRMSALLQTTLGVSFGTGLGRPHAANFKTKGGNLMPATAPFSGIYRDVIEDEYWLDGQLEWEVTRPYPCTVVALGGYLHTQDQ